MSQSPDRPPAGRRRADQHSDQPSGLESSPLAGLAETPDEHPPERSAVIASGAFGALLVLIAAVVLVDAAGLPDSDEAVGPAAVPTLVGILMAVIGVALIVRAVLDLRTAESDEPVPRERLVRLAAMVAALVVFALILPLVGFVVSAALLFTAAALLLGAPGVARTLAIGWTLAIAVFLVFDALIGLTLPAGPWGF